MPEVRTRVFSAARKKTNNLSLGVLILVFNELYLCVAFRMPGGRWRSARMMRGLVKTGFARLPGRWSACERDSRKDGGKPVASRLWCRGRETAYVG